MARKDRPGRPPAPPGPPPAQAGRSARFARNLSTDTQAPPPPAAHSGRVLWSDPRDEPSPEARRMQERMQRAGRVLAALVLVGAVLVMLSRWFT
ncbi:morphogenic membrane protein MmpB [Streptomyces sp. FH025]|uniref:morphogenic membrane protein MmpB n=1 Tax=Streptomyces sp. FH025 TaxID=2815937 RepID=UPI0035ADC43A